MPGKKVNQQKVKRSRNKQRSGFAPVTSITQSRTVSFPYSSGHLLGEAAPAAGFVYSFRLNSLFDPDFTGTGYQPLGFDQFSALYGRYAVQRTRFSIAYANTTSQPIRVGYFISPQSTVPATSWVWSVQPYGKSATAGAVGSGRDVVDLRGSTSMAKQLGVTTRQYQDEADFSATTSASPVRILYLHVFIHGITAASNATCVAFVKLSQDSELSQLVSQTYS